MNAPAECVFARNCKVRRLDKKRAADFLNENHFLGSCSARFHYGLFINRKTGTSETPLPKDTLVAVGSFSNGRRFKDGHLSYEWIRYASLKSLRVVGGMSKILNRFVEEMHPGDIMTYVDASHSDGSAYKLLGFEQECKVEKNGFINLKLKRYFPQQDE